MSFTAIENTPIVVDLLMQANTTGWTQDGTNAVHQSCNSGSTILTTYPVMAGVEYQISYIVLAVSGGNVQPRSPGFNGTARTTSGLFVENLFPTSNGFISFYSNANCTITGFNIKPVVTTPGITVVYSAGDKKWSDFRTFYPDFGWSLYTRTITAYQGQLYSHINGGSDTNNFYGEQFQSSIKFVEAKDAGLIKEFQMLSYQANMLLITTLNGIQSSLGQISTLIDTDFIKQELEDGALEVTVYQNDGVYSASFLNDENECIVNGSSLRGNFLIVELITVDGSTPLTLFSVGIRKRIVPIGSR